MNYQIASIRSIACLLVLITHVSAIFYIDASAEFQSLFLAYLNQVSRFGTPIFCVITGFLFAKYFFTGLDIKAFYKSRVQKIFTPYLLWSILYISMMYRFFPDLFINFIHKPLLNFLSGKVFYHLYFISVIFQFCFIFPILCYLNKVNILLILALSLIINIICLYIFSNYPDLSILSDRAFLGNWIFYFIFGIFFYKIREIKIKKYMNIFIPLFILSAVSLEFYSSNTLFSSTRLANIIYIPLLFVFLYNIFIYIKSPYLLKIGHYSMGIYLIHPIVILLVEKLIPAQIFAHLPVLSFIALYVMTLIICLLFCHSISRLHISKYIITTPKRQNTD